METPVGEECAKDGHSKSKTIVCGRNGPVFFFFILQLFFLISPALSIHIDDTESHSEFSCEPIRLRMCQDLPYNTTFMPNLLNHYDQQTAALAMEVRFLSIF